MEYDNFVLKMLLKNNRIQETGTDHHSSGSRDYTPCLCSYFQSTVIIATFPLTSDKTILEVISR